MSWRLRLNRTSQYSIVAAWKATKSSTPARSICFCRGKRDIFGTVDLTFGNGTVVLQKCKICCTPSSPASKRSTWKCEAWKFLVRPWETDLVYHISVLDMICGRYLELWQEDYEINSCSVKLPVFFLVLIKPVNKWKKCILAQFA